MSQRNRREIKETIYAWWSSNIGNRENNPAAGEAGTMTLLAPCTHRPLRHHDNVAEDLFCQVPVFRCSPAADVGRVVNAEGWRIPARTLEHVMTASLSDLCRSESRLMDLMSPEEPGIAALTGLKARAAGLSAQLSNGPLEEQRGILHAIIQRIDLTPASIVLILHKTALARLLDLPYPDDQSCVSIRVPVRLRRRGVEPKMIIDSPDAGTCNPDLCRLIAQAHLWFDQLASGEACTAP